MRRIGCSLAMVSLAIVLGMSPVGCLCCHRVCQTTCPSKVCYTQPVTTCYDVSGCAVPSSCPSAPAPTAMPQR